MLFSGALSICTEKPMPLFYKKEQQNIMSEPNETGEGCLTLDSTINNKEFITSSGIMLVAPVLPFIIIIIILLQRNF